MPVTIFFQFLLNSIDTTAESVYIAQDFHCFGNKGISIITHVGEIIGTNLAV
nr:MAG TPA: hypothetical protein [Caudoviricetes sp.]